MIHTIRSYLRQFSFSSSFGKCGKSANKILSVALVFAMLFSFALPTYAVDVDVSNGDWKITKNFCYFRDNTQKYVSVQSVTGYSNDLTSVVNEYSNLSAISEYWTTGKLKLNTIISNTSNSALVTKDNDIRIELKNNFIHAYISGGDVKKLFTKDFIFDVVVYDIDGNAHTVDNATVNATITNSSYNQYSLIADIPYQDFDVYKIVIGSYYDTSAFYGTGDIVAFSYGFMNGSLSVTVDEGDKTTGLLDTIIEWIKQIVEDIKNLPEKIKTALSSLFDKITTKLEELGNNIIEGLKSLFIPEDGFFDEKKAEMEAFLEEHFGIIYTAPNIVITIFEKLLTISPGEPCLTFPAIEFEFLGEYIKLSDPITINLYDFVKEGTPLYTLYQFYRAAATAFLIFLFVTYAMNKYNYLFGKDGEAVG